MYWGHISASLEAMPSKVKTFDYGGDGSIEGIEMYWQVLGSENEDINKGNRLIGQIVITQIIMLVGGYDDSKLVPVGSALVEFIMSEMKAATVNDITRTFGNAVVTYRVVNDGGKNTPRLRIGMCPSF
jgi:hypothetical protein